MTRQEPNRPPVCRMCGPLLTLSSCRAYTAGLGVTVHVRALHDEQQPLAGLEPGARRQDLDVEPDDFAARHRQRALVRQHRQVRRGALAVGFPVGGSLPADRHRAVLELGVVGERDRPALRVELEQGHEYVQVFGLRPQRCQI